MMELQITKSIQLLVVLITFSMVVLHGSCYNYNDDNNMAKIEQNPVQREPKKKYSKETLGKIETQLLSLFKMKSRPIFKDRNEIARVPKLMMELYEQQKNQEYTDSEFPLPGKFPTSANTVRYYHHEESSIDDKFQSGHRFRLFFDMSDIPSTEKIVSTELRLTIKVPNDNESDEQQRVHIYDIVKPGIKGQTDPILNLIDSQLIILPPPKDQDQQNEMLTDNWNSSIKASTITYQHSQHVRLDVSPIVERWMSSSSSPDNATNHGILVDVCTARDCTKKVSKSHVRLRRSTPDDDDESPSDWHDTQPILLAFLHDPELEDPMNLRQINDDQDQQPRDTHARSKRRARRSNNRKRSAKKSSECGRKYLKVDFKAVGWNDWIVAPTGYDAFYCEGECPRSLSDHFNSTNHAIIQSLVNSVHPMSIPKACCVPTTLLPTSMLYTDATTKKAVLKNYPDMVVEGCGCR